MDDFYVVLPSSVRNLTGNVNHSGHYTTYMNTPITLDREQWKVAATEVTLSNCWFNITKDMGQMIIGFTSEPTPISVQIEAGYYESTTGLLDAINKQLKDGGSKGYFYAREESPDRVYLSLPPGEYVVFHRSLCTILGFEEDDNCMFINDGVENNLLFIARRKCNTNRTLQNIYVYCSIIKPSVLGDSTVPILRVFPANAAQHSTIIHHEFLHPHYRALETGDLSVIEIKLCDKYGNILTFHSGDVVLQLHFKRF